jgi:hypothetical protein
MTPMNTPEPARIDRRVAIKWMLTAGAGAMMTGPRFLAGAAPTAGAYQPARAAAVGYGSDPDLVKGYKPGDLWPLTFTSAQRRQVGLLCDIVIPADDQSPSASAVGVTDYIDEVVSAPYPDFAREGKDILDGLAWIDAESSRRHGAAFADATDSQRAALCEDISYEEPKDPALKAGADFFRRFRNLVAAGYYTTPAGMKDIGYIGNVPLAKFEGPPADLVAKLGLTDEVVW